MASSLYRGNGRRRPAVVVVLPIVLSWPADKVGDALQLGGLMIASLGVPILPGWLRRPEAALERGAAQMRDWTRARVEATRRWWSRRRGRAQHHSITVADSVAVADGVSAVVGCNRVDRSTVTDRERLEHLDDRVYSPIPWIERIDHEQAADRPAWEQRIAAASDDLRRPTLLVPRRGWQFIIGGAACTALGIVITLAA